MNKLRSLKKLVAAIGMFAIAISSAASYAAWTDDTASVDSTIGLGDIQGALSLTLGSGTEIAIEDLIPYDQQNYNASKFNVVGQVELNVADTDSNTDWWIIVENYDASELDNTSKLQYSLDQSVWNDLDEDVVITNGTGAQASINLYIRLVSDENDDMGAEVTFNLLLIDFDPT